MNNIIPPSNFESSPNVYSPEIFEQKSWTFIGIYIVACFMLLAPGLGVPARFLYPAMTFGLAVFLFKHSKPLYLGFCFWSWILTAEYVRLVEFSSRSFDTTRLMLVAPYLILILLLPYAIRQLLRVRENLSLFILPLAAVLYAVVTSVAQGVEATSLLKAIFDWTCPILLAFFIAENWQDYPVYRDVVVKVFRLAVILLGVYGVIQFLVAPPWDRYWLEQIAVNELGGGAFGQPEPLKIRVYSLMQSPGEFAIFLNAILLIQFSDKNISALTTSLGGYFSFLLTTVRSAWGGWIAGAFILISMPRPKIHTKFILLGLLGFCALLPLLSMEQFSDTVLSRFESFGDLENDVSGQARLTTYAYYLPEAINSVVGRGLGRVPSFDSAVLDCLLSLGWVGTLPYIGGLLMPGFIILRQPIERHDSFLQACKAVYVATLLQLLFGSAMLGVSGIVLWGFSGFVIAGYKYGLYDRQNRYRAKPLVGTTPYSS